MIRGSWKVNADGTLEEQPRADYAAEAEEQKQRLIAERDQAERDAYPGVRI